MRRWFVLGVSCAAWSACSGSTPNIEPQARLRTPVIADARLPVELDARASDDQDGTITAFIYNFGDGSPVIERTDAIVDHVFPGAGRFTMQLTVRDDDGAEDTLTREITLVDRFTPPYCSEQEPCGTDQTCEETDAGGVCFEENP